MKLTSLLSFVVACVIGLSAVSASAQQTTCRTLFGRTTQGGTPIQFKADGTAISTAYGYTWINVIMQNAGSPPSSADCHGKVWIVTAIDTATQQPATWVKLFRQQSASSVQPVPAGAGPSFSASLSNTVVSAVDPNTGAARSASITVTVVGGTTAVLPIVTITQAGQ